MVPSTCCLPPGGLPGAHMMPDGALVCHQRCGLMWPQYSAPLAVREHPQHRLVSWQEQCTVIAAQQAPASFKVSHGAAASSANLSHSHRWQLHLKNSANADRCQPNKHMAAGHNGDC